MKSKSTQNLYKRFHSLDSLRGIMMILGIVLHSAIIYSPINSHEISNVLFLKDPISSHISNSFIVDFIHSFRMQIFFILSGFFGAFLYYKKSPLQMIKNRISRILFPFLIFETLLGPILNFSENYSIDILNNIQTEFSNSIFEPFIGHFWFLYYLMIITIIFSGFVLLFKRFDHIGNAISKIFEKIITKPFFRISFFSLFTVIVYLLMDGLNALMPPKIASFFMPEPFPSEPRIRLVPNPLMIIFYLSFYMFGWFLYKSNGYLKYFKSFDWASFILGFTIFCMYFFYKSSIGYLEFLIIKPIMTWLFIFGITGVFIRYFSSYSPKTRYISDSSYWVYLVHMEFCYLIPCLIFSWNIPSTLKFLIVTTLTSLICFLSYHYLVRNTFVGKFLNGRKYPRKTI